MTPVPLFGETKNLFFGLIGGLSIATMFAIILTVIKWRNDRKKNASLEALLATSEAILDTLEDIEEHLRRKK